MKKAASDSTVYRRPGKDLLLWIGLLLPPAVWITQLQTVYLASEYGCSTSNFKWNHVVSLFCLLLAVTGGIIARQGGSMANEQEELKGEKTATTTRFMSIMGMVLAGLFSTLIFAQWLPTLIGVPCFR
ncbi:MAG: hypothetical protein JO053_01110 [Acidobacteria bacterium]|nr:hypothetical protein [Acidobacteriota bacterium]